MFNYLKSLLNGKEKIDPIWQWQTDFKNVVNSECTLEVFDVAEGKQIIITNSGETKHSFTIGAIFEEAEVIPGKSTEKDFKFNDAREKLNFDGVIYKAKIDGAQKIELVRGKWSTVKFIQIESTLVWKGEIKAEIERVARLHNRNELGRVPELLEAGYFAEGMQNDFNLHFACARCCFAIAELLINKGVDVDKSHQYDRGNGFGPFATRTQILNERAVHLAAKNGDLEMVKLLASSNADFT